MLHGFPSQKKFDNYIKCLQNIKINSILEYNAENNVQLVRPIIGKCSVAFIDDIPYNYDRYSETDLGNLSIGRRILLKTSLSNRDFHDFMDFGGLTRADIKAACGESRTLYRYRFLNSQVLLTKIINPALKQDEAAEAKKPGPVQYDSPLISKWVSHYFTY